MKKVLIIRILNLDGTWQGYKLSSVNAYQKENWVEAGKTFNQLNKIIDFYNLQRVRELGVKYSYDNKDQKYGIETYEAIM